MNTVLIVGATGVIGDAALEHFAAAPEWHSLAISRRKPEAKGHYVHLPLDLTDASACKNASARLTEVTHLIYAAVAERPGLVSGWRDRDLMATNLAMFRNLLDPLCEVATGLQHITLLQGAKAYGAHAGLLPPVPAREDAPRVQHENFYWLQEDYLRAKSEQQGLGWTVFRPQVVIGAAWGAAMNPLLALATYGFLRREEGKLFGYPGGELRVAEIVDATLLAEAFMWAATAKEAQHEIFNITNGDVMAWRELWPVLADALGVGLGPDEPMSVAEFLSARVTLWDQIVTREGLRPLPLMRFLGESHHYADILLRAGPQKAQRPMLLSTIKLRRAGFAGCRDSEAAILHSIATMRARRLIPQN